MGARLVSLAELPPEARALFGGDFFSTLSWYETVVQTALPPETTADFLVVQHQGAVAGVLPLARTRGVWSSLTTPYSQLWQPLLAPGADAAMVGTALADLCRRAPVRLDAMDVSCPAWIGITEGLRRAGIRTLAFAHFGNWIFPGAAMGWDAYLASRTGAFRELIRRRTRKLLQAGARFQVIGGGDGLAGGIAAYEAMHAKSWKDTEPFPDFIPALIRACAADGTVRLGVLSLHGRTLAAQLWVVAGGTGMLLKLAHDSSAGAWSPGTVLTGLMVQRLMTHDAVQALDFGRGDDDYKKHWMSQRRQIYGVILANPLWPAGAIAIAKHTVGALVRGVRESGG
jgi:CelD/BcsL family acetyltransferase involved in cellulose biosynthesis